ncbi:MAG: hypothetical protein QOC92_2629 [Acidimicrobiaceae bacterium]
MISSGIGRTATQQHGTAQAAGLGGNLNAIDIKLAAEPDGHLTKLVTLLGLGRDIR